MMYMQAVVMHSTTAEDEYKRVSSTGVWSALKTMPILIYNIVML